MSAYRRHFLGGRTVAETTPWASAFMTGDVVRQIFELDLPTITLHASGPRGPFQAYGLGTNASGHTVIAAVGNLVRASKVAEPTETELRMLAGDR